MEDNMEGHEEQLKENKENNHSKKKMSAKERMQAYRARLKANKAQHDKHVRSTTQKNKEAVEGIKKNVATEQTTIRTRLFTLSIFVPYKVV
ncbi:hypothetical protein RRG08_063746 [Elysia crispata]|uniref:Uncharacterized protein n=1 Tax=Elysia crispata TaxID=231223 RepID=A0AAE1E0G6_9GAST|nr:hypothetical protein RRG08_063746 [Elysia crispata]